MAEPTVSIKNLTRARLPSLAFESLKNEVLGTEYELSVVFVGDKRAQELNRQYRGKDYIPDVLSFSITGAEGELVMNPAQIRRQSPAYGKTYGQMLAFLFIHGLFHLKGMAHGSKMETKEKAVRAKFSLD